MNRELLKTLRKVAADIEVEDRLPPAAAMAQAKQWLQEQITVPAMEAVWSLFGHTVVRSVGPVDGLHCIEMAAKGHYVNDELWEAMAPLLAAAPDMLALLNRLADDQKRCMEGRADPASLLAEQHAACLELIRKAEANMHIPEVV